MSENPITPDQARDQAAEYFGFARPVRITVGSKVFEIPNPGTLDDDQQEAYEDLQDRTNKCDKHTIKVPILEEATVETFGDDGQLIERRTEKQLVSYHEVEQPVIPYAIDGVRLKPPYNVQLATALFGEKGYEDYKAGGGRSSQILLEWKRMEKEFQERVNRDPKSGDGAEGVGSVGDSA